MSTDVVMEPAAPEAVAVADEAVVPNKEETVADETPAEPTTEKKVEGAGAAEGKPAAEAPEPGTSAAPQAAPAVDLATLTDEQLSERVLRQIEFYFSDSNLPYDKFLYTLSTQDPSTHYVPLGTVATFKRMREYTAVKGVAWIASLVREKSTFLEVDETGEKVRRKKWLSDRKPQTAYDSFARSIYAKGFGEEYPGLQIELEEFFLQFGKFNQVRMRRDMNKPERPFKSSVFVEFAELKDAQAFLALDPKPTFKGTELLTMSKKAYVDMKAIEHGFDTNPPKKARDSTPAEGEPRKKQEFNAYKIMAAERREREDKAKRERSSNTDVFVEVDGHKIKVQKDGTVKEEDVQFTPGKVLHFSGTEGDVPWAAIREPLKDLPGFDKLFIDFERGDTQGLMCVYGEPLTDEQIATVQQKVPKIDGRDVAWRRATEEEDKRYWVKRAGFLATRSTKRAPANNHGKGSEKSSGNRGGRGGGRGGRGGAKAHGREVKGAASTNGKAKPQTPAKGAAKGKPGAEGEDRKPVKADGVPVIQSSAGPSGTNGETAAKAKGEPESGEVVEKRMKSRQATPAAEGGASVSALKRKREDGAEVGGEEGPGKKTKVEEGAAAES